MSMLVKARRLLAKKILARPHNHLGSPIPPAYLPDFPVSHRYFLISLRL
jgi:hypothetical protein